MSGFALLGHPASFDHFGDLLARDRPSFDRDKLHRHREILEKFFEWIPPYESESGLQATFTGADVDGRLVVTPFLPAWLSSPRQLAIARAKTLEACQLARDAGARVIALGGFTSIIGQSLGRELAELGPHVTTGNALTAALAVAQLRELLAALELDARALCLAIVGGTGDIGSACARALKDDFRELLLIGRSGPKLRIAGDALGARTSRNVDDALAAHVIILATSAAEPLIAARQLPPGTIVCDVGYPKTVARARHRTDVLVFAGGIAELPFSLPLEHVTQLGQPRHLFGCFTEAMIVAATGRPEGAGTGRVSQEHMAAMLERAQHLGVRPAAAHRATGADTANLTELRAAMCARLTQE